MSCHSMPPKICIITFGQIRKTAEKDHSDAVLCLLNWLLIDDACPPNPEASVSKFSFSTYFRLLLSVLALTSFGVEPNEIHSRIVPDRCDSIINSVRTFPQHLSLIKTSIGLIQNVHSQHSVHSLWVTVFVCVCARVRDCVWNEFIQQENSFEFGNSYASSNSRV